MNGLTLTEEAVIELARLLPPMLEVAQLLAPIPPFNLDFAIEKNSSSPSSSLSSN